jgi:hypothetical protein
LNAPGSTKLLFTELAPFEPPAWPPDQLLACCCGAACCGARAGAAARSLFGGALNSSAMACPAMTNMESTPTLEISNFLMTPPSHPQNLRDTMKASVTVVNGF